MTPLDLAKWKASHEPDVEDMQEVVEIHWRRRA